MRLLSRTTRSEQEKVLSETREMIEKIRNYLIDETAAEDIQVVMFTVIGISCAIAIGWWIWNTLAAQTEKSKCGGQNANPFCVE